MNHSSIKRALHLRVWVFEFVASRRRGGPMIGSGRDDGVQYDDGRMFLRDVLSALRAGLPKPR